MFVAPSRCGSISTASNRRPTGCNSGSSSSSSSNSSSSSSSSSSKPPSRGGRTIVARGALTLSEWLVVSLFLGYCYCCCCFTSPVTASSSSSSSSSSSHGGWDVLQLRHVRSRERHSTERSKIRWGLQAFDNLTLSYDAYNESSSAETEQAAETTSSSSSSSAASAIAVGDINQSLYAIAPGEMFHLDANEEQQANNAAGAGGGGGSGGGASNGLAYVGPFDGGVVVAARFVDAAVVASSGTNHGGGGGVGAVGGTANSSTSRPVGGKKKVKKRKIMADIQSDVAKGLAYIRRQSELGADVSSVPEEVLKSFTADPIWTTSPPPATTTTTTTMTTTTAPPVRVTTKLPTTAQPATSLSTFRPKTTAAPESLLKVAAATEQPSQPEPPANHDDELATRRRGPPHPQVFGGGVEANDQNSTQSGRHASAPTVAAVPVAAAAAGRPEKTPEPEQFKQEVLQFTPVLVTTDNSLSPDANYTELNAFGDGDGTDDDGRFGGIATNDTLLIDGVTGGGGGIGGAGAAGSGGRRNAPTSSPDYYIDLEGLDETSRNNRINLMNGRDLVTQFLHIVETQHSLGSNCTAGTALNLGEGIVDRYAQDRFRVEAEIAVNRANMLTRIFKQASPAVHLSEHLLHASVLSMVEFDEDIFAAGNCFDFNQHPLKRGLYCPFAYRLPEPDKGTTFAKDLAAEYHYLGNTSEWFYLARKNAEKVIEKNEQYIKAYHLYTNSAEREFDEILSVKYEDGRWSKPYYDCGGGNIWMLTYTVPFFGFDNGSYFFKGTSGIDIDLRRVDIDQCPQRTVAGVTQPLNLFAGTDKCKHRTTECSAISGLGFRRGSYKCTCRRGFYFPDTSIPQKYFNGTALEEEYEKLMMSEPSEYNQPTQFECLPCSEGCDTCTDSSPCVAALNWPMRTAILVLACAIISLLPPATYFTYRYQHIKVLRAASPVLLRVIALGAFFIYCTTVVIYAKPSLYTCTARIWLREIGFSLTYGALMLKTWRISVIFRVRSAKAVKITDASLLKRLGVLCGCVAVALLVRTIVAPPVVVVRRTADDLKAFLCKNDWWDHFFTSMEVLFLAWGVRLCIMVRKAPSEFNESRFISIAIYNEFLLTCFLNVSMFFLQSPANPDLLYIIFFCHTQLTVSVLLGLIFGHKVYTVIRNDGKPTEDTIYMGAKSSTGKFIPRSQPKTFTNNPSSSSTAQIDPDTDSRFTDDDAVQQIRVLCAQLLNLQDRASVREVASATIATLLENCGSSHTSTLRPPPNSPPHAALKNAVGVYVANKATNTSCDELPPTTPTVPTAPAATGNHCRAQCCRCQPLSAGVAMSDTQPASTCPSCPPAPAASLSAPAIIETYPSCSSIQCMCSDEQLAAVDDGDDRPAAATVIGRTGNGPVAPTDRQPEGGSEERTSSSATHSRRSSKNGASKGAVKSPADNVSQGHSNILVYAQLGNSGTSGVADGSGPNSLLPVGAAQPASLEVDEELNRNSIVLDDNDYNASDCGLETDVDDSMGADVSTNGGAGGRNGSGGAGSSNKGTKLVLDLSDRSKYTKEVSV